MPKELSFDSEKLPGATFVLRAMSREFRHQIEFKLADVRYENKLLLDQYIKIVFDDNGRRKLEKPLTLEQLADWRKESTLDPSEQLLTETEVQKIKRIDVDTTNIDTSLRMAVAKARLLRFTLPAEEDYAGIKTTEDLYESDLPEIETFLFEIEGKAQEGWLLMESFKKS